MVFNEILILQDPFTETNVTRKRSVVGNSNVKSENIIRKLFLSKLIFSNFI